MLYNSSGSQSVVPSSEASASSEFIRNANSQSTFQYGPIRNWGSSSAPVLQKPCRGGGGGSWGILAWGPLHCFLMLKCQGSSKQSSVLRPSEDNCADLGQQGKFLLGKGHWNSYEFQRTAYQAALPSLRKLWEELGTCTSCNVLIIEKK